MRSPIPCMSTTLLGRSWGPRRWRGAAGGSGARLAPAGPAPGGAAESEAGFGAPVIGMIGAGTLFRRTTSCSRRETSGR